MKRRNNMNICEISYHIMDRNSFDYLEGLLEQLNKKKIG